MNNGQPPYGDPSAWGQQNPPGTVNPGQYPVQPNPYLQQGYQQPASQPGQTPYQQPYQAQTYQAQQHTQQTPYQQQAWQPYQPPVQQQGQVQSPYGQGGYQQPYQQPVQPPMQQQTYQQPVYQQVQQPQQAFQQGAVQSYPQFNQQGQQVYGQQGYNQGYSGYYSQPQEKKFSIPFDVIAKVALFGVLPLLFILAMVLGGAALKWVFLAGAVAGIALMWMRDVLSPNMRLTMSLVLGAMAVAALVGALGGAPADVTNQPAGGNSVSQQNQTQNNQPAATATNSPVPTATPTPDPNTVQGEAVEQLMSFFFFWSTNNYEQMLSLTAPSWRASVEKPEQSLFTILLNRTPLDDYDVTAITGTDNDTTRQATVKVSINKNNGRTTFDRYAFKIIMLKEDGVWYVDPRSLESHEAETETATPATENTTPTQIPLYTGYPTTVLYYNPDGGSRYHLDPYCTSVNARYTPLAGQFYFSQVGEDPYNKLEACNECGAPIQE